MISSGGIFGRKSMRGLKWFAAGAVAVPLFHQLVVAVMNATGFIDRSPYSFAATKPFGVPELISLSFWGGVWGVILMLVVGRMTGAKFWRSEEHTSELQSRLHLVCRLLLEKKNTRAS